jgi:murein DD-endopeptidase MepM/ murein hydrolase activator NlpD
VNLAPVERAHASSTMPENRLDHTASHLDRRFLGRMLELGLMVFLVVAHPHHESQSPSPATAQESRAPTVSARIAVPIVAAPASITARTGRRRFAWPISGTLTSGFGRRGFWSWHAGVDIVARRGTPIRAAAPGTVRLSAWQSSYGRVIRIAHARGFSTVYAHNSRNFVKVGDRVERGTIIGAVGHTGRASGDHLHFEVRRDGVPRNPLSFLPPQASVPVSVKERTSG